MVLIAASPSRVLSSYAILFKYVGFGAASPAFTASFAWVICSCNFASVLVSSVFTFSAVGSSASGSSVIKGDFMVAASPSITSPMALARFSSGVSPVSFGFCTKRRAVFTVCAATLLEVFQSVGLVMSTFDNRLGLAANKLERASFDVITLPSIVKLLKINLPFFVGTPSVGWRITPFAFNSAA